MRSGGAKSSLIPLTASSGLDFGGAGGICCWEDMDALPESFADCPTVEARDGDELVGIIVTPLLNPLDFRFSTSDI